MIKMNRQNRALQKGNKFGWRIIEEEKNLPIKVYSQKELAEAKEERNDRIKTNGLVNRIIGSLVITLILVVIYCFWVL